MDATPEEHWLPVVGGSPVRCAMLDVRRCVVCGDPVCDHVALARCAKTWIKHRVIVAISWLLGLLPWAREDIW